MKKFRSVVLLFLFLLSSTILFAQVSDSKKRIIEKGKLDKPIPPEKKNELVGYPVAPFKDTLFFIYNKIGSFKAENRATAIASRIDSLYNDPFYSPDSLLVSTSDGSVDVVYKRDFIIMSVTESDAKVVGDNSFSLAQKNRSIINKTILYQQEYNSERNWLKRIGLSVLLLVIIILIVWIINRLFRWFKLYVIRNKEKHLTGLKVKESYVFSPDKQLEFVLRIIGIIRIVVLVFVLYISLPVLFSVFPATKHYATILLKWIFSPAKSALMGFVHFLPNLFSIIVIVLLFVYLIKAIKFFVNEIHKGQIKIDGFYSDWAIPTFNIIKILMYAFMVVIIFPYLPGSNSPIFQGVSVFIGILFSLGSSNAIANMIAGLVITYMRPFKTGDFIKIGDVSGTVLEKTALVTRIRTSKFEDITIPNATVLSSSSINYSSNTKDDSNGLVIHTTVTIGYDTDWKEVHKALINAATRTDLLESIPAPFVLQTSLDDFYVSYEINGYTKQPTQQPLIYSKLHQNIQDCFNEAGLEIMSPHYNALRDGNKTTTPNNYLNSEYKSPAFNVDVTKK
ncbi:mechanosensitive ion channel [Flavobacterium sp. ZT3R18]|uniref:mechanosensitive ion channel family protein n=1 Tax=Flavobacterium sp. ZT3R18 TaxID=2594429 RepID=UPI001179A9A2|nr:mechanosensitive ion channel domain-containing protein [Flavobacterium sp. ZT3R18]TRX37354.1 mechanosensitive ion channel [Flavobacterium sp. ZT3R18]